MSELNIYAKIMKIRTTFLDLEIKKSGHNKFSNFYYFELKDFLCNATRLFNEHKLYTRFSIIPATPTTEETATFLIVNSEAPSETDVYTLPTAECFIGQKKDGTGGADPIQNLGGKITYLRRYMYLIALDLIEDDSVDSKEQISHPKKPQSEPKHETKSLGNVTEAEAFKLAIQKGMETIEKTLIKVDNFPYRDTVIENVCSIYGWKTWKDATFRDNNGYKKLLEIVNQELQKEKDLAQAGV